MNNLLTRAEIYELLDETYGVDKPLLKEKEYLNRKSEDFWFEVEFTSPLEIMLKCCVTYDNTFEFAKGIVFTVYLPRGAKVKSEKVYSPYSLTKGNANWALTAKHSGFSITADGLFDQLDAITDLAIDLLMED